MQKVRGAFEEGVVEGYTEANCMFSGLKALMHGKYGDIILLCTVVLAFGMLLALSATG